MIAAGQRKYALISIIYFAPWRGVAVSWPIDRTLGYRGVAEKDADFGALKIYRQCGEEHINPVLLIMGRPKPAP